MVSVTLKAGSQYVVSRIQHVARIEQISIQAFGVQMGARRRTTVGNGFELASSELTRHIVKLQLLVLLGSFRTKKVKSVILFTFVWYHNFFV